LNAGSGAHPLPPPAGAPGPVNARASIHGALQEEIQQAKATAEKLRIPFVDPLTAHIEPAAAGLIAKDTATRLQALPVRLVNNILLVAMASPEKTAAVRALEVLPSCKVQPAAAPKTALTMAVDRIFAKPVAPGPPKTLAAKQARPSERAETETTKVRTISIISNKGGVGKTHVAINLAYALAQKGSRTLLIDADLGNADISNKLAIFPEHHLLDFLQKDYDMQDLIVKTDFGFDLVCGTYGEFKLANLNYAQKTRFINHFKKVSQGYDLAVFDLGAGIARTVLDFALGADHTIIVTTPQDLISGYACAKAAFVRFKEIEERLENRLADYTPRWGFSPLIVINQVKNVEQGFKLFEALVKTTEENINPKEDRFHVTPRYLGSIPYDKDTVRATEARKKPLLDAFPHARASECLAHMTGLFLDPEHGYDPRIRFKSSFKRFAAILSRRL